MDRNILYRLRAALSGEKVAVAKEIALTLDGVTQDNVEDYLTVVSSDISVLQNTAFNSGRSFIRFNDGFTIDRNNIATYEDKNIIYTAKNDKPLDGATRPDIHLPNDTEIQASTEAYPIVFEFTHLGGSARFTDTNLVQFLLDGVIIGSIQRDQVAIITKESAGSDYVIQGSVFDPNQTILPNGVFNLKTETDIDTIATIGTELSAVTIVAGDSFLVQVGGSWSGYTVTDDSVLVALVNNPSLVDSATNDDWLLLDNSRVNAIAAALLSNFVQDGITFNTNRNIKIDPSNVTEFNSMATGTPITRQLGTNTQGSGREIRYDNVPIQFTDLVGGNLEILIRVDTTSSSGFVLDPVELQLHYSDDVIFTFPLTTVELDGGQYRLRITIPNDDYSAILNTDVSLRFIYNFNGASWFGSYTIDAVMNSATGTLHDPIVAIAQTEATNVSQSLTARINAIQGGVDTNTSTFAGIEDRLSPYRDVSLNQPETSKAFFTDSTGVDAFPSSLTGLTHVTPDNPVFTVAGTDAFVVVESTGSFSLSNNTSGVPTFLSSEEASTNPNLDLGASFSDNGVFYFAYRVSGLTASDVLEVFSVRSEQVVAWQSDIDQLEDDVQDINARLSHPSLNIPDDVAGILTHDLTVTDSTGADPTPTDYNRSLSGTGAVAVFNQSPVTGVPVSGYVQSNALSTSASSMRGQKLFVVGQSAFPSTPTNILRADNGSGVKVNLMDIDPLGVVTINELVPSISAGSQTVTVYPLPSTLARRDWFTVAGHTGSLQAEADELAFTRDVPTSATTLNYRVRYAANGGTGATVSRTLAGVGGDSDVSDSFILSLPDGESFSIEVVWQAQFNRIEYRASPNASNSDFFIFDTQVGMDFQETRVVPAVPESVRVRTVGTLNTGDPLVIATLPSSVRTTGSTNPNLIIVTNIGEIDTGYSYDTLFTSTDAGFVEINEGTANVYDYNLLVPSQVVLEDVARRAVLPYNGFYTDDHTYETVVDLDTQLQVRNAADDVVNVGQELVLVAPDTTRWRLSVDNSGNLVTTEEV